MNEVEESMRFKTVMEQGVDETNEVEESKRFIEVMKVANVSRNISEFKIKLDMNGIIKPNLAKIEKKEAELLDRLFDQSVEVSMDFWNCKNYKPNEFTFQNYFTAKMNGEKTPLLVVYNMNAVDDGINVTRVSYLTKDNNVRFFSTTNDFEDIKSKIVGAHGVTPIFADDTLRFAMIYDRLDNIMRNI